MTYRKSKQKLYVMCNLTILVIAVSLGVAVLYFFENVIIAIFLVLLSPWKIGISNSPEIHRQKQVSVAAPGVVVLVCTWSVGNARRWEQTLHGVCKVFKMTYYKGDGHSEWFFMPAALIVFSIMIIRFAIIILVLASIAYLAVQFWVSC
jgi:hypothetical protein